MFFGFSMEFWLNNHISEKYNRSNILRSESYVISTVMRLRREMLSLYYNVSRSERSVPLCNTAGDVEDLVHFVGTCPVLRGVTCQMARKGL